MIICVDSSGHYPEEHFDIPDELYKKVVAFSEKYEVWSDSYRKDKGKERDELKKELEKYKIKIPSFCSYC